MIYGYVYLTHDLTNGMMYVGQTIRKGLWHSGKYNGSGCYFQNAKDKHGEENFTSEIVELTPHGVDEKESIAILDRAEIKWIHFYRTNYGPDRLYNIATGGKSGGPGTHSEETKQKMSASRSAWLSVPENMEIHRQSVIRARAENTEMYSNLMLDAWAKAKEDGAKYEAWRDALKRGKRDPEKRKRWYDAAVAPKCVEFSFRDPSGEIKTGRNLKRFCRENDLDYMTMYFIRRGNGKDHRGWTLA
jgi:group I intron endonuclease